jgi:mRNA-degrading endonuclease RelE of RelBE toxin-antitoxin system
MNKIKWTGKALKQIRRVPVSYKRLILEKIDLLVSFPVVSADIKKLQGREGYRLRVGVYRVIFEHEACVKIVTIEEVKKRDERTY